MSISRLYDFTPNTIILSAEVDAELNQLVSEVNLMWKKDASENITGDPIILKSDPSVIFSGSEASGKNFKIKESAGVAYLQFDNSGYQSMYILDNANGRHTFQTPGGTSLLKLETTAPTMHVEVANSFFDTYTRPTGTSVAKRGVAISGSSGTFATTSTSLVDVTNLSVTIVVTSRPVVVMIVGDGSGGTSMLRARETTAGGSVGGTFSILRGSTVLANNLLSSVVSASPNLTLSTPPTCVATVDNPGAGTYTYKLQASMSAGGEGVDVFNCKLIAYEL